MRKALALCAVLAGGIGVTGGMMVATSSPAQAVVYCQYVNYPANCVVRKGVVLRPRPVAREAVRPGTPTNRGGPVDRAGRR